MIFIGLLFSAWAFSATQEQNIFEKSFPRDNTFCSYKDSRIEIQIRGSAKFIEPKEKGYGDLIFYKRGTNQPKLLPLANFQSDTFRLFLGTSPFCSKSHGYILNKETAAVLFLKENRPAKDMLVLQLFDLKNLQPKEFIETNFIADKAQKTDQGFAFRTYNEIHDLAVGKVQINGAEYIYNEKSFPRWVSYSDKGFEGLGEMSYEKFPWKEHFKDLKDFLETTGWDEKTKLFTGQFLYLAVNHKIKKRCLFISRTKIKLEGNESWRCQTI